MKPFRQVWTKVRRLSKSQKTNICAECPHWKSTKFLLKCFGLWPYQSKFTRTCSYSIFFTWTLMLLLPMVDGLMNRQDICTVIESLIGIAWILGTLVQGTMLFLRPQWLSKLFGQIDNDWRNVTDKEELTILHKYSRYGNRLNLIYMGTSAVGYFGFLLLVYLPLYINSNNVHRDIENVFPFYSPHWIITENQRIVQIIVITYLETIYGALLYITVMFIYIGSVMHTCGMYAIVSYRLKNLVPACGKILPSKEESDAKVFPRMLDVVEKHRAAIKSAHIVGRIFSRTFFAIQISLLLIVAATTFDLSFNIKNIYSVARILFIGTIFVLHTLYMNYGGQQIIEFSNKVFVSTYFIDWHLLSTNARKILSMIILRSSRTKKLSAGGMILSLENFTTIMKASWSLATALLSMQKNLVYRNY